MRKIRGLVKREEGLSLIELLVVVAIMGILATLTAVAVTGTTSKTKGAGKVNDEDTTGNAISAYAGEHPQGRNPTLDGCAPANSGGLASLTKVCDSSSGTGRPVQEFSIFEQDFAVDVNQDGAITTGNLVKVVPIIFTQFFTGDDNEARVFSINFVDDPKHAFEDVNGDSFKANTAARTEDGFILASVPVISTATGDCPAVLGKCPVWVINEFNEAIALLPGTSY